eukprot:TRINITY_DN1780_c0_g1_i2.p1 TRINITY_DN1780_c0_g1~~TRINITY_DN1780_c0_g1_i2.p1  ORF type:complete len:313 (-),score=72.76 TRINITY_DN1780_c0_g1_i2:343-1281(-)
MVMSTLSRWNPIRFLLPHSPESLSSETDSEDLEEWMDGRRPSMPIDATKALGPPIVILKSVSKSYKIPGRSEQVSALRNVNLCEESDFGPIRRGEFIMILGPSGGGKTTLLNIIGTIDKVSSGTVELMGRTINEKSPDSMLSDIRLAEIGFVFQSFNLLATMSAFENVELPMTILGKLTPTQRRRRALQLLNLVGLRDRVSHLPSELSGGEQQRVTIARALANDPKLLLLDEPTGDLDTRNTVEIMNLLVDINRMKKTTCIMVTHNPDLECYADRILYVSDGGFSLQAINQQQTKLRLDDYLEYLNKIHEQS